MKRGMKDYVTPGMAVVEQQPTEIWYDLLGRRVSNNSSTRQLPNSSTIYIVNGKKVIK